MGQLNGDIMEKKEIHTLLIEMEKEGLLRKIGKTKGQKWLPSSKFHKELHIAVTKTPEEEMEGDINEALDKKLIEAIVNCGKDDGYSEEELGDRLAIMKIHYPIEK